MGTVITGMGMVTPIGNTVQETWQGFMCGKLGGCRVKRFANMNLRVQIAAEVPGWLPDEVVQRLPQVRQNDIKR